jgi:hypothetical protein
MRLEKSEAEDMIFNDDQMRQLRSDISDLGHELDARKMAEAAAMGGGVFAALLAGGAAYELTAGNAGLWMEFGIDRETLTLIAWGLGALGVALLVWAIVRRRRGNPELEEKLSALEQQYADLRDRKKSLESRPTNN